MNIEETFHAIFIGKYPWPDLESLSELKLDSNPVLVTNAKEVEKFVKAVDDWVWSFEVAQSWVDVKSDLHVKLGHDFSWYMEGMHSKVEDYATWYGWREGIFKPE